jgi:hypothetical protein
MDYFAGLDVSVKETSVCIVDDAGKIVRETRVPRSPAEVYAAHPSYPAAEANLNRISLEIWARGNRTSAFCKSPHHGGMRHAGDSSRHMHPWPTRALPDPDLM